MQTDNELAPHIQDIAQVLEDKVEFELDEIETDLRKYTGVLSLPLDEAKRCIISNYLKSVKTDNHQLKYLAELLPNENSVNLFCKIISVNPKEVRVNGGTKQIYYGLLSDQTGTLSYTAWNDFKLQKGDAVRISNAYTRDWQGNPEIQFGDKTQVQQTTEELKTSNVPLNKTSTKAQAPSKEYNVIEFQDGLSNISVKIRILSIEPREITVKGTKKTIFSGIAADATGKCRFTTWKDLNININDVIEIKGGYIKSWRGLPDLGIDENMQVNKLSDDVLPPLEDLAADRKLLINQLSELGAVTGVAVEGMVLDIKKGSGLIYRCTECKRVLQKNMCMVHGKQEGVPDLRIKAIIDDGTGTLSTVIAKEVTEKILNRNLEDCESLIYKTRNLEIINEELIAKLIAQPIRVHGNIITDDYGLMMICNDAELIEIDVKTEAAKLLESLASEGGFSYANNT